MPQPSQYSEADDPLSRDSRLSGGSKTTFGGRHDRSHGLPESVLPSANSLMTDENRNGDSLTVATIQEARLRQFDAEQELKDCLDKIEKLERSNEALTAALSASDAEKAVLIEDIRNTQLSLSLMERHASEQYGSILGTGWNDTNRRTITGGRIRKGLSRLTAPFRSGGAGLEDRLVDI
nr:hypothetical protein L204_03720 [Cryptococcus depauperatus CBS 7855]